MSVQIKVARLLGAVLVMLALVPWLGISPAAATGGGSDKGSSAAQGHGNNARPKREGRQGREGPPSPTAKKSDAKAADKKPDVKAADKGAAKNSSSSNQKVTLCHRTNSDHNPYVRITVSINSVIKSSGHDGHNGPVYAAGLKAAHQKWGDIIPAFSYDGGSYPGQNWAAGSAIFGAGCAVGNGGGHTTPPTTITVTATPSGGGGGTSQKVTLCHRTNSDHNPYVRITVSINSVIKSSGHDGHNGPVYAAGMKAAHQKWGDIIPSFTYTAKTGDTASYGGKNWPAGQAIFDAGCMLGQPTTRSKRPRSARPARRRSDRINGKPRRRAPGPAHQDRHRRHRRSRRQHRSASADRPGPAARRRAGLSFLFLLAGGALIVVPSM